MSVPTATLIQLTDVEAIFEARPGRSGAPVWAILGGAVLVVLLAYLIFTTSRVAMILLILMAVLEAFLICLALLEVRAVYRVRLDFEAGKIEITDVRGPFSFPSRWTGQFELIDEVQSSGELMSILWKDGTGGPMLSASPPQCDLVKSRLEDCLR